MIKVFAAVAITTSPIKREFPPSGFGVVFNGKKDG
jgi:hypothetical protein